MGFREGFYGLQVYRGCARIGLICLGEVQVPREFSPRASEATASQTEAQCPCLQAVLLFPGSASQGARNHCA